MSKHEFWHKDSAGKEAPLKLVDKTWFHHGTSCLYRTTGVGFDSERDRWVIIYTPSGGDGIDYFHLPEDFTRVGENGLPRFTEVKQGV